MRGLHNPEGEQLFDMADLSVRSIVRQAMLTRANVRKATLEMFIGPDVMVTIIAERANAECDPGGEQR